MLQQDHKGMTAPQTEAVDSAISSGSGSVPSTTKPATAEIEASDEQIKAAYRLCGQLLGPLEYRQFLIGFRAGYRAAVLKIETEQGQTKKTEGRDSR